MKRAESTGYLVNHLARLLANTLRAHIGAYGVVPGQFAQLLALYEGDGITQTELCEHVGIDQSTMAHTLKRMARDGLIRREPDPADGRRALIWLTTRARALEAELVRAAQQVNALATNGFSEREIVASRHLIVRMIDNLERPVTDAPEHLGSVPTSSINGDDRP